MAKLSKNQKDILMRLYRGEVLHFERYCLGTPAYYHWEGAAPNERHPNITVRSLIDKKFIEVVNHTDNKYRGHTVVLTNTGRALIKEM